MSEKEGEKLPKWMKVIEDGVVEVETRDGKFVLEDISELELAKIRRRTSDPETGKPRPQFEYELIAAMIREPKQYHNSGTSIDKLRVSTVCRLRYAVAYLLYGNTDFLQMK